MKWRLTAQPRRARASTWRAICWGIPTNIGQVTSIRTLERQIRRLKASEYDELRSLGEEIGQACAREPDCVWDPAAAAEPFAPTLARHAEVDAHLVQARADLRQWTRQNLTWAGAPPELGQVDLIRPGEVAADIVATLLYPVTNPPFPRAVPDGGGLGTRRDGARVD